MRKSPPDVHLLRRASSLQAGRASAGAKTLCEHPPVSIVPPSLPPAGGGAQPRGSRGQGGAKLSGGGSGRGGFLTRLGWWLWWAVVNSASGESRRLRHCAVFPDTRKTLALKPAVAGKLQYTEISDSRSVWLMPLGHVLTTRPGGLARRPKEEAAQQHRAAVSVGAHPTPAPARRAGGPGGPPGPGRRVARLRLAALLGGTRGFSLLPRRSVSTAQLLARASPETAHGCPPGLG